MQKSWATEWKKEDLYKYIHGYVLKSDLLTSDSLYPWLAQIIFSYSRQTDIQIIFSVGQKIDSVILRAI